MLWNMYCLIRLSVIYRGRAVPLVWCVLQHGRAQVAFGAYRDLLDRVVGGARHRSLSGSTQRLRASLAPDHLSFPCTLFWSCLHICCKKYLTYPGT
jgi:hypothetical protein